MTHYYTVEKGKNTDAKQSNNMAGLSDYGGIINPLFDGLTQADILLIARVLHNL